MALTAGDIVIATDGTHVETDSDLAKIYVSQTTLTNAQVIALPTSAITLIAAPGANKFIDVHSITASINVTTPWTNVNVTFAELDFYLGSILGDTIVGFLYNDSSDTVSYLTDVLASSAVLKVRQNQVLKEVDNYGMIVAYGQRTNLVNQALKTKISNNGSGVLTGGNVANNIIITTIYSIANI